MDNDHVMEKLAYDKYGNNICEPIKRWGKMQKKNSFDEITLKKIGRGVLINLCGAGAVFLTSYAETGKIKESAMIAGSSFLSSIINIIREYKAGE